MGDWDVDGVANIGPQMWGGREIPKYIRRTDRGTNATDQPCKGASRQRYRRLRAFTTLKTTHHVKRKDASRHCISYINQQGRTVPNGSSEHQCNLGS